MGSKAANLLLLLLFLTFNALVANPKKTTLLHGGQSCSWSAEQGIKIKNKKYGSAPPQRCSFGYMSCTRLDSHIMHVSFSFSFFFFFFFFSFCLFGDSAFFPDYFCCCTFAAFSLYVVRSFLPNGKFRPCDHGLDF